MVDNNIDGFVEPTLYLWDEAYLIMSDDVFDSFLPSVCKYFIEEFYITAHKENWSEFLLC